jgi:hypothetical protein
MRGERVLTLLLEAGDVIHLCHQHDSGCSACLSHWEIDAVVTENPAVVCDRVAVKWAHTARQLLGGLCGLIYAAAGQTRIKVWAAMVAAVLVSSPQKV